MSMKPMPLRPGQTSQQSANRAKDGSRALFKHLFLKLRNEALSRCSLQTFNLLRQPPQVSSPILFPIFILNPPWDSESSYSVPSPALRLPPRFQDRYKHARRNLLLVPPTSMATNVEITSLGESFEKKLNLPGAKVGATVVSEVAWNSVVQQNKLSLAVKVLGKSTLSVRKCLELFTGVLWSRASNLHMSFEGETASGSRLFLAKFSSEEDRSSVLERRPWTIGGLMVLLEIYDPLKRVADHSFGETPVWLQLHGLPPYVAKHKDFILSLAEKAGNPIEKSIAVHRDFTKINLILNPSLQLTSGSFLSRSNQKPISVLFKYGLICYRCAHLGHREKECAHPSFIESTPTAFSFLEGIQASDSPTFPNRSSGKSAGGLSDENPGGKPKTSPLVPKNLLTDLEADLLGSGSKIEVIDRDHMIKSPSKVVNTAKLDVDNALKNLCQDVQPLPSLQESIQTAHPTVSQILAAACLPGTEKVCSNILGQSFIFQANQQVAPQVTPVRIKATNRRKGPGPMWQKVRIGTESMRKMVPSPNSNKITGADSPYSENSQYDPSESSSYSGDNSIKSNLLEWRGNFSGFQCQETASNYTEEEEESTEADVEGEASVTMGMKRSAPALKDAKVLWLK